MSRNVTQTPGKLSLFAAMALVVACDEPKRPWQAEHDGGIVDESEPFLPPSEAKPLLADASIGDESLDAGDLALPTPTRMGGLWKRCHAGFERSGHPLRDVTRLGLLCGPANGMRRIAGPHRGQVGPSEPAEHAFRVKADRCYRVFAAAGSGIDDLQVIVLSSRGSRVASNRERSGWPIVDPDRPFCTFEDDRFRLRLSSEDAADRYAVEVWELP